MESARAQRTGPTSEEVAPAATASPAAASTPLAEMRSLRIPLTIDYLALDAAMKQQIFTDHGRAPIWNGADPCQYLFTENPRFGRAGDKIKLETDGSLMIGVMMGARCVSPIAWKGIIEAETAPYVASHLQLKFRVTDLNLYDQTHQKTLLVGKAFDLIKQYYIPKLETFSFDLSPAFAEFEELVKASAPPEVAERVAQTLATLKAESQLEAEENGVRTVLDLTVPPFEALPTPSAPVQLTPEQLAAFEKNLDQWDSFLVFAIKQMDVGKDLQLRDDLLALLLDSRYRLIDALSHPQAAGPDPIRILFLDEWQRLGEIIRAAARRGTLGSQALQFLSFLSAGDALFAFDQAAPALGIRISSDDLRRLAQIIAPHSTANPLAFSFEEDPELRKMFHMKQPLAEEGPLDTESNVVETPTASPSPSGSPTESASPTPSTESTASGVATVSRAAATPQSATEPPLSPAAKPSQTISPTTEPSPVASSAPLSFLQYPLGLLTLDTADAAESAPSENDLVAKLQALAKKLKRAIVGPDNADDYRVNYDQLLQYGAQREIAEENLDYRFRPLYLRLVKSAAWQESCWRQFVLKGNRITYLESSTHDLGLMQVNKYVWRGFYNINRLEWDVLYNASAGMEILARLLDSIELKRGAFSERNPDELARSIYAAYNGGPGAYRRWRGSEPKLLHAIDRSFWEKYQAVSHGRQIDILSCAQEWAVEH